MTPIEDDSEQLTRARFVKANDAFLALLCRHHPEQSPAGVNAFYARKAEEDKFAEVVDSSPEDIEAQKISDWVKRQQELHPSLRDWNQVSGVSVSAIQRHVCEVFGITKLQLVSQRKTRKSLVPARQAGIYLTRELTVHSFPEIGRRFGGRDHSTVIHAIRQAEIKIASDPIFAERVRSIQAVLQSEAAE